MKSSKKLLSLFLAVVMVFSVLTVMASAYTVGPEVAGDINYKYTVEKVASVPTTEAGSVEYTADNLYAVTAWMQCDSAVMNVTIPFHYNKAKFSLITLSDGSVTYPAGAGLSQDTYVTDMGESAVYAYTLGDFMNNTGMYNAAGGTAATKALAKCIGLGNSNSAGIDKVVEIVSPDHSLYSKWGAGLPENTGVMYASLNVTGKSKTAYFNTIEGIETSTEWVKMITVYFESLTEDVEGAEFGVFTDDCFTVDGATDEAGYGYFVNATTSVVGNPNKNVVSNAKVAAAAEPKVEHVDTMGQMGDWATLTGNFNGGFVGKISNLDLTFDGNECTNLLKIEVTLNDKSAEAYQVYEQADGSYLFRAVVRGMDITSTDNISAVYTIYVDTDGDGAADKQYSSDAIDTNAKAIYEEALANYQAA